MKQAAKIDLFDDVDAGVGTALTRDDVAQMALNALEATMVETDGDGGTTIKGDGFEITTGSTKYIDVVKSSSDKKWNAIDKDKDSDGKAIVQLGEDLFDGDLKKESDKDDLGRPASVWSYKGTDIGKYADEADYTFVVSNGDFGKKGLETVLEYVQDVLDNDDLEYAVNDNKTVTTTFYANGDKGEDKVGDAMKYRGGDLDRRRR